MDSIALVMACGSFGALEPLLSIYLVTTFGVSQELVIFAFLIPTLAYPLTVALINTVLKNMQNKAKMVIGLFLTGFALLLVGPSPLTGLSPNIILTTISLFFAGSGMAFTMVPALADMVDDATGILNHLEPTLISDRLSALVALSTYLGKAAFGPFSGWLKDYMSFENALTIVSFIAISYAITFGLVGGGFKAIVGKKTYKSRAETLLSEKEMVESRKSFYLLEEDEV
jgi:MFS family permease